MAVRGGQLILVHGRGRLGCCGTSSVEDDGPDPGLERTFAPEGTTSVDRACKRLLHESLGVLAPDERLELDAQREVGREGGIDHRGNNHMAETVSGRSRRSSSAMCLISASTSPMPSGSAPSMSAYPTALPQPRSSTSRAAAMRSRLCALGPQQSQWGSEQGGGGEPPSASRNVRATPFGRPPGLPETPGGKGRPILLTVASLFSAGSLIEVKSRWRPAPQDRWGRSVPCEGSFFIAPPSASPGSYPELERGDTARVSAHSTHPPPQRRSHGARSGLAWVDTDPVSRREGRG